LGRQLRKDPIEGFPSFIAYLCRRFFRLIPLMWVSICFAFILNGLRVPNPFALFYSTLLLQDIRLNIPLWSLQVELWCSLFFPILFWMFRTSGIFYNILLFIGFIFLSYFGNKPIFMQYWVFFHAGLLIDMLGSNLNHLKIKSPLFIISAYFLYILAPEFGIGPRNGNYGCWQSWVLLEIVACSLIVFFIVYNKNTMINTFFQRPLIRYLGKISFSIYLIHIPLLQFLLSKYPISSIWQLGVFSICYLILTFSISSLTYYWVEIPFNKIGKKLYFYILHPRLHNHLSKEVLEIKN
jgi:peptidoglycan/LPS O-acetylase OafA/YrhL